MDFFACNDVGGGGSRDAPLAYVRENLDVISWKVIRLNAARSGFLVLALLTAAFCPTRDCG